MTSRARNTAAWRLKKKLGAGEALSDVENRWAKRYDELYARRKILEGAAAPEAAEASAAAPLVEDVPRVTDVPQRPAPAVPTSPPPPPAAAEPSPEPAPREEPEDAEPAAPIPAAPPAGAASTPPQEPEVVRLADLAERLQDAHERGEDVDEEEATEIVAAVAGLDREELAEYCADAYEAWLLEMRAVSEAAGVGRPLPVMLIRGLLKPCARAVALQYLPHDAGRLSGGIVLAGGVYQWRQGAAAKTVLAARGESYTGSEATPEPIARENREQAERGAELRERRAQELRERMAELERRRQAKQEPEPEEEDDGTSFDLDGFLAQYEGAAE